jgi:hypothetical protein
VSHSAQISNERLEPPEYINTMLGEVFGYNYFGEPMFRMAWGQTATLTVRGNHGYRDMLVGHNKPIWLLQRWCSPELYWTPELYYKLTADVDGYALLGEYPEFGRYETIISFMSKRFDDLAKRLIIETIPLDFGILDKLIPLLVAAANLSAAEQQVAIDDIETQENTERVAQIADRMYDELPNFYGPVSYAGQQNRTALIERMKENVEKVWKRKQVAKNRPHPQRGFFQEQN